MGRKAEAKGELEIDSKCSKISISANGFADKRSCRLVLSPVEVRAIWGNL
jgi:hypothetical protein